MAAKGKKPELREFQFVVQPVLLLFEDDKVPTQVNAEPVLLSGLSELSTFIESFPASLAKINEELGTRSS